MARLAKLSALYFYLVAFLAVTPSLVLSAPHGHGGHHGPGPSPSCTAVTITTFVTVTPTTSPVTTPLDPTSTDGAPITTEDPPPTSTKLPSTVTTADPPTSTTSETPAPTESSSEDHGDPILAGSIDRQCLTGEEYDGVAQGWNITLAGVPTYYNKPSLAWRQANPGPAKVLLFYSDVYSPFFMNNILLMDWYASQGYWVFGLDYFLGDSAQNQVQPYDVEAWVAFAKARADPLVPAWNAAVRSLFPPGTKYVSVGYCFGAPFSMEAAATNEVVAAAFGQPALLTESHFYNVTQPLFMSCAEIDMTFPTSSRNRAMDILSEIGAVHHLQVFGGTEHGFATRADLTDPASVWAKQESANSILGWFDRFTA